MSPNGWAEARLDEFGEVFCGQSPTAKDVNQDGCGTPYVTGPEQWDGTKVLETKWTTDPRRVVPDGCVFITVKGAGVGTLFPGISCAIGRDVYAFKPVGGIDQTFVFYALKETINLVVREARGDIPGLSKHHLLKHSIGIPPSKEQRRIVAKLEELFSELDAGVAALRRAQRRLARYRQALLQAAVTGELTREWREQQTHGIKIGKLDPFELPIGWRMVTFREVIQSLRNGISVKPTAQSGTPILRISSVRPMRANLSDIRYLEQPATDFEGFEVRPHDLLFTRYNGTPDFVGVCAMVPNFDGPLFYPDKLIRARMGTDEALPAWVQVAFSAGSTRAFISDRIRTTAGQAGISGSDLKQAPLPIPPIEEQRAVLAELDLRLSTVDALEATLQASLRRAERLRQSILERAFRGELVPQDPHDEPAEALLARLKAAAPDTPAPRRRGRPPKAEPAEPQTPRRRGRPRKAAPLASGGSA